MNTILFDGPEWSQLLPLTYTRPIAAVRCGVLTITEKWNTILKTPISYASRDYLSNKFESVLANENLFINGSILPDTEFTQKLESLKLDEVLIKEGSVLAFKCNKQVADELIQIIKKGKLEISNFSKIEYSATLSTITHSWDIFQKTGNEIKKDIELLGIKANSKEIKNENTIFGDEFYIEAGAKIRGAILNSEEGPIYIGKNAEVMEGSVIRGPFSLGDDSTVKMASKIYGPTSIGPHCKVGGEVTNIVMFAYSNKGHDGFIGNSVIGEWCNFGADTNSSNLKNNYSPVRIWSYNSDKMENTGLQFCGLIAGDHCKTGISTMLNTSTVLGVCANVFGSGFPPKFIPSFSWGGANKMVTFKLDKSFEVAGNMMKRRGLSLTNEDKKIFQHVFLSDALYRK